MQDRPTATELLHAVQRFLEDQAVPALDGTRRFHARVAANVVAIVARELVEGERTLVDEWHRLRRLLRPDERVTPPTAASALARAVAELGTELAERIRAGDADRGPFREAVLAHLRQTSIEKLAIANPRHLGGRGRG